MPTFWFVEPIEKAEKKRQTEIGSPPFQHCTPVTSTNVRLTVDSVKKSKTRCSRIKDIVFFMPHIPLVPTQNAPRPPTVWSENVMCLVQLNFVHFQTCSLQHLTLTQVSSLETIYQISRGSLWTLHTSPSTFSNQVALLSTLPPSQVWTKKERLDSKKKKKHYYFFL